MATTSGIYSFSRLTRGSLSLGPLADRSNTHGYCALLCPALLRPHRPLACTEPLASAPRPQLSGPCARTIQQPLHAIVASPGGWHLASPCTPTCSPASRPTFRLVPSPAPSTAHVLRLLASPWAPAPLPTSWRSLDVGGWHTEQGTRAKSTSGPSNETAANGKLTDWMEDMKNNVQQLVLRQEAQAEELKLLVEEQKRLAELQTAVMKKQDWMERGINSLLWSTSRQLKQEAREAAERQFGLQYARPLTAVALDEITSYLVEVVKVHKSAEYFTRERLARQLSAALVHRKIPEQLLRCMGAKVKHINNGVNVNWFDNSGGIDLKKVEKFADGCKDYQLRAALERLKETLEKSEEDQIEHLMLPGSPGIMCLVAASHPQLFLDETESENLIPNGRLDFDMYGRSRVYADGSFAFFEIAEVVDVAAVVEHSLSYSRAVAQLGLRLGVLTWAVKICLWEEDWEQKSATKNNEKDEVKEGPDFALNGRLFVPRELGTHHERRDDQHRTAAKTTWGFDLMLEFF